MAGVPVILTNYDDTTPLIGYDNLLRTTGVTVTESSESAGFESENAYDWLEYSQWLPSAGGASWIRASFSTAQACDYFACAAHTIGSNSGSIVLQYSTNGGSTWANAFTAIVPAATEVIWQSFDSISAADWRVLVTSTPPASIGVLSFGTALQMERGLKPGFTDPDLAFNDNITNSKSINGTFLGRSLISEGIETAIAFEDATAAWVHDSWLPFMQHARQYPFFLQWNDAAYSDGSALVWTTGPIDRPTWSRVGFMSGQVSLAGTVD